MSRDHYPQAPDRHYEFTNKGVVIIGAGIGGMLQAIDLLKKGIKNFVILEKSSNVGGTWLQNQYPGCQCDVLSVLYSISYEQNDQWSRRYPGQEEMLDYLINIASKHHLYRYIRFNSFVDTLSWDDVSQKWHVNVRAAGEDNEYHNSYRMTSDFLVSAVGQLNQPQYPKIKSLDTFRGKTMHTARWDWSYDLRGKRVAIIGSGATAVQVIPEIASQVAHLTVHQRTANWVVTRNDRAIPEWKKALFQHVPYFQARERAAEMNFREWTHGNISRKPDVTALFYADFQRKLREAFPHDADMRETLTPNYELGCKRIIVSDDYLPALARPNVRLETDPIAEITESGIAVARGEGLPPSHEDVDLIVLATGFRSVEFMHPIDVTARRGRPLKDIWAGGAQAMYGVTVEDMPNFGILYGPNTNLGHSSIILMEEAQVAYLGTLIESVLSARGTKSTSVHSETDTSAAGLAPLTLCPKKELVASYNEALQRHMQETSFTDANCASWYKDPKTGRVTNNWSGTVIEYQKMLERVKWDEYEGGEEAARRMGGKAVVHLPRVREEATVGDTVLAGVGVVGLLALAGTAVSMFMRGSRGFSVFSRA